MKGEGGTKKGEGEGTTEVDGGVRIEGGGERVVKTGGVLTGVGGGMTGGVLKEGGGRVGIEGGGVKTGKRTGGANGGGRRRRRRRSRSQIQ